MYDSTIAVAVSTSTQVHLAGLFLLPPPLSSLPFAHERTSKQKAHLTSIGSCTSLRASRADAPSANRNPHWLPAMTWQGPICTPPAIERFTLHRVGPRDIPKQPGTGTAFGLTTVPLEVRTDLLSILTKYEVQSMGLGLEHASSWGCFNFPVQIGY